MTRHRPSDLVRIEAIPIISVGCDIEPEVVFMQVSVDQLLSALDDEGVVAGLSYEAVLEPLGGPGSPVKPAVYTGGVYQQDRRWWQDEPVDVVVIDNVPSQANRMEAALERHRSRLGLPILELNLEGISGLPPHVPSRITSLQFPHRHADSYLRDAIVATTGEAFLESDIGRALVASSADSPEALLQWMPQSLIFGFWQSHLGKKAAQTKFARAVESEIVGYQPASTETRRLGLKGDPLNLSIDEAVTFDPDDLRSWEVASTARAGRAKAKDSLAEIGHGQVPIGGEGSLGAVSFRAIGQHTTISFPRLRTITVGTREQNAAARALLAALAIVAAEAAFGGGFSLRSGCDLRPVKRELTWRGDAGDEAVDRLGLDGAVELFGAACEHAAGAGLPVGSAWQGDPVELLPNEQLAKVIAATFGLEAE